ncbi:MAG: type III secretion system export apparatus subunit SctT [Puniceicoccales bacterium]|jgi:type III secretion protein T|nr:type III secretion system export apparatus subunit SctT [Puniceicoccales bacterium]
MISFLFQSRGFFISLIFGLVRTAAMFSVIPFFGKKNVMGMGRNAWILGITIFIFPFFSSEYANPNIPIGTILLITTKEVAIGVILGFLASFIFFVAEGVGNLIDVQRGASAASLFSSFNESQTTVMADFFVQIVLLLFFLSGGFRFLLEILYQSYAVWPIFSFIPSFNGPIAAFFTRFIGDYMYTVFALVGPILFALFLAEFGLGMVNRFAPQLNVFFLSMGIKSGLSSLFLILLFSFLMDFFTPYFFEQSRALEFFRTFWR